MKLNNLPLWMVCVALLTSCGSNTQENTDDAQQSEPLSLSSSVPVFIPKDTANVMLDSYLRSINPAGDSADLTALILNADSLRAYLSDTSIKHAKVMLAHTLPYIHAGHAGKPAGYRHGALTIIVAGYNAAGNYVYRNGQYLLNMATPCPPFCALTGTAAGNLFP